MKKYLFSKTSLLLLAMITCVLVAFIPYLGRGYRFDLTENQLFTLSQGSKNIVQRLDKPITLTLFFSNEQTKSIPELRNYAQRVRDLLQEYALLSDGKLKFIEVDPEPFSEAEDQASSAGLKSVPLSENSDPIYFGVLGASQQGANQQSGQEVIPFFSPTREKFLEYDISQLIYRLAHPQLHKIGLLTSLPMRGGFDVLQQKPTQAWVVLSQLEKLYKVQDIPLDVKKIDPDIDMLMLVHPKNLSQSTLYALDQFVLRGGKLMVFVDPWAETDTAEHESHSSDQLTPLFKQWGIFWSANQVVADDQFALPVNKPGSSQPERHLGVIGLRDASFAKNNPVTDRLNSVNVATAGNLQPIKGATTHFVSLMRSSHQAMIMPRAPFENLQDANELLKTFKSTGKSYTVMADISGPAKTAFPQGAPDAELASEPRIIQSKQPIHVVVIADTDILTDRLWVQVEEFFGQLVADPIANNGDLITNLMDYLSGSPDLIQVRQRAPYQRPFDRVNQLQLRTEQAFRKSEHALEIHLAETEKQLTALQHTGQNNAAADLLPQQKKTLEKFQQQKLKIRKQLRDVRHQLDKDIENLGMWLKMINILLVPILLTLVALGFAWRKRQRRG